MFVNIHTHNPSNSNNVEIHNLYKDFELTAGQGYFSVGLHPWYIQLINWEQEFAALKKISNNKNVLAIGESGLDKICSTDFIFQEEVFSAHIQLANQINKPLIIHCVRAYDEVITLLNKNQNQVPVIFHGFNKNLQLAKQLISKGYYLSIGKEIQQLRLKQLITDLPVDRIFFETDDSLIPIQSIFETASFDLKIDMDLLCLQIQKNAAKVFNL